MRYKDFYSHLFENYNPSARGYWIGPSGQVLVVNSVGEHGTIAKRFLVNLNKNKYDSIDNFEAGYVLMKRGFLHVERSPHGKEIEIHNPHLNWDKLTKSQKRFFEDLVLNYGKIIYMNDTKITEYEI